MNHESVIHHLHLRAKSFRESANIHLAAGDGDLAARCDDDADDCIRAMRMLGTKKATDGTLHIPSNDLDDDLVSALIDSAKVEGVEQGIAEGRRLGQEAVLGMGWRARRRLRRELRDRVIDDIVDHAIGQGDVEREDVLAWSHSLSS